MSELIKLKNKASEYTVLIVEDSTHIQKQMKNFATKLFKEVYLADNGLMGLSLYKKNLPDLVLTDLTMPEMDGHEFILKLKELNPNIEIVIISAHGYEENIVKFKNLGVNEFIQKPVNYDNLISSLLASLSRLENDSDLEEYTGLFKELYELKLEDTPIELVNHYKGIPFIHEAKIIKLEDKKILIKTQNVHVKVLMYEKRTIFHFKDKIISAKLDSYDKSSNTICLYDLVEVETSPKNRKEVRVDPDELFSASIFAKSERFTYKIESISISSVAFKTKKISNKFKVDDEVDLVFGFKTEYTASFDNKIVHKERLSLKASVYKIYKLDSDYDKIIFTYSLSFGNRKILENYLTQRQMELVNEFKDLKL